MRSPSARAGSVAAGATLAVLVVADTVTSADSVALSPLFALAPIVAAAVLPARGTTVFAALALVAAVAAGFWNGNAWTVQNLVRLLDVGLMGSAAVAVSAFRVHREQQVVRLTRLAEVAQRAVLPVLPVHARRTDIAARYLSATQDTVIGGDLFDCYHSRGHTRFLLGDVRGKGIEAIEQAARVIRAFRQAAAVQPSLDEVADDMSSYLMPFFDDEEFVTAVLLDTTVAERPVLVSAGHPPPLLVRSDGTCTFVEVEADLPLGLGLRFDHHEFSWEPGDRLLLYTDGLSEARDEAGHFLDLRELGPLLRAGSLDDALDAALDRIRAHAVRGDLSDDVAVLLLEHTAAGDEYLPVEGQHDWTASLRR